MSLTKEWSDFDPKKGYEKEMQDVLLKNGDIIHKCWPNAGMWCVCREEGNGDYYGKDIPVQEADKVRLTHDPNW